MLLLLATALSRLPFRSQVPINWDAVQYILALRHFDIAKHQPHPPGNPLYILVGRGAQRVIGDPNQALVAVSIVASVVAVWATALLGARLIGRAAGLWAGLLLAINPLFWFYGEVALSYAPEVAVGALAALAAWHAARHPSWRAALLVGVVFALAGGVRPTVLPLLGLLWLFSLWRLSWQDRAVAVGATTAGCLAWLIPLLALSGGPRAYWTQLHRLTVFSVEPTSVLVYGPTAHWLHNLLGVVAAMLVALNLFGLLVALALVRRHWIQRATLPGEAWRAKLRGIQPRTIFLWAWVLPPLAMFTLVHFGQWGYLLLILPPLLLLGLIALERAGSLLSRAGAVRVGSGALACLAIFLLVPELSGEAGGWFQPTRAALSAHDAAWKTTSRIIDALPPQHTLVLTSADSLQSFRLASYLLPRYDVLGVGSDWQGDWGEMYQAEDGRSTYQLNPRLRANELVTAPNVSFVVVLDESLADRIADPVSWTRMTLSDGSPLLLRATVSPTAYVSFVDGQVRVFSGTAEAAPGGHIQPPPPQP